MPDGNRKLEMPMHTRLAPISGFNKAARTIDVVWSLGARVQRVDFWTGERYFEELSLDPAHVDLSRLQNGAPVLDTHQRWGLSGVIGVVENASVDGKEGRASLRFSKRDDVQPIVQDIEDKIIRNVSVGYTTQKAERYVDQESGLNVYRAVRWQPSEISFVPVGADAGAGTRAGEVRKYPCEIIETNPADSATTRKESNMDEQQRAAEEAAKKKAAEDAAAEAAKRAADEATAKERARVAQINELVRSQGLKQELADDLVARGVALDEARKLVLDELAKKTEKTQIRSGIAGIETTRDETEVRRAGATEWLLHRYNPGVYKITDGGKQFAGMNLRELMRDCLEAKGIRTRGMTVDRMWERTFESGSDLPNIVLDAANKTLRAAYESSPRTFVAWTKQGSAPDFKNINRIQLSGAPSLLQVNAGAEFKRGAVTDGKETYALLTYGRILGINRQAIINDDMSAFTRLPELAARAAADLESDTVYGIVTANAAMSDGVALFHASHSNLSGSSDALAVASLGAGRAGMRAQKGLEGRPINVAPKYLIVPVAKETLAWQYTSADFVSAKSSDINPFREGRTSAMTPIAEPRLDANSATAWYLAADPAQIDTIEYSYLEGQKGVYLETRMGWDIDGMELKVREDFAAKALDWRGLWKNPGA